jgi:TolB protein
LTRFPIRSFRGPLRSTFLLVLGLTAARAVCGQTPDQSREKSITIQKGAIQIIPLVVEDFTAGPGATAADVQAVYRVLVEDLQFSNYFAITQVPLLAADDPVASGAKALVRGTVEMAQGQLVLRGSLEALPAKSRILSRDYATRPDWYREAAHRFADDIVLFLTGEKGVARTRIAFVSNRTGNKEIYVVDYDGFGLRAVTHNKSINLSPSWSPDARQLVFTSFKKGDSDVYLIDLATGQERLVAGGPGVQGGASFSPDGKWILFSHTQGRESEIFMVPAAGGTARRVTREGGINTSPSWAPDGRRLVFTSDRSGTPQLYVTDVDGGISRRLTFGGTWNDLASWSPTGEMVAYSARQDGGFRVAMVDPSGLGDERVVTQGPGSEEHPSWAPNGRHVAYSSNGPGQSGIYVLHVDSGQKRTVIEGTGSFQGAAWSPIPPR